LVLLLPESPVLENYQLYQYKYPAYSAVTVPLLILIMKAL
jgi:hypothetical protein